VPKRQAPRCGTCDVSSGSPYTTSVGVAGSPNRQAADFAGRETKAFDERPTKSRRAPPCCRAVRGIRPTAVTDPDRSRDPSRSRTTFAYSYDLEGDEWPGGGYRAVALRLDLVFQPPRQALVGPCPAAAIGGRHHPGPEFFFTAVPRLPRDRLTCVISRSSSVISCGLLARRAGALA